MAATPGTPQWIELERAGMAALDEFMETFNSGSPLRWAQSLHYPHMRLGGLAVQIWNTPDDYARDNDVSRLREASGWGYTKWDRRKMIQADEDKIHMAVQFSRYTPAHEKIVAFESFYILTRMNGHWGTQFRSSYAGVIGGNTAF